MSYKGYSFNLHKEDDKEIIEWLSNKKVTQTIKMALRNQMKSEGNAATDIELLSVIKRAIESSGGNHNIPIAEEKIKPNTNKDDDEKSLSEEDADDFEKIFDI